MREAANNIVKELKHINMEDLKILYDKFGISIMEYGENILNAVFESEYDNEKVRNCAKALEALIIDMLYLELKNDEKYRRIIKGEQIMERLVGRRFNTLYEIKEEIEKITHKKIGTIFESESERPEECGFYDRL